MSKGTSLVQIIHLTVTFLYSFRTVSCDYLLALYGRCPITGVSL